MPFLNMLVSMQRVVSLVRRSARLIARLRNVNSSHRPFPTPPWKCLLGSHGFVPRHFGPTLASLRFLGEARVLMNLLMAVPERRLMLCWLPDRGNKRSSEASIQESLRA